MFLYKSISGFSPFHTHIGMFLNEILLVKQSLYAIQQLVYILWITEWFVYGTHPNGHFFQILIILGNASVITVNLDTEGCVLKWIFYEANLYGQGKHILTVITWTVHIMIMNSVLIYYVKLCISNFVKYRDSKYRTLLTPPIFLGLFFLSPIPSLQSGKTNHSVLPCKRYTHRIGDTTADFLEHYP